MLSVGLTGGIGAGKSAVSELLAELRATVIDADRVAREVVAPGTPGLAAVVEAFGAELLLPDGSLDRLALGQRVFADDAARARLNGIVHPLVGERTRQLMAEAQGDVLVHDVPLLVENGLAPAYHLVVVVDAPVPTRLARLQQRGLEEEQAQARIAAQATDEQRRAVTDVWLDNSGTREQLAEQVRELYAERLLPYAQNLRQGRWAERSAVTLEDADEGRAAAGARLVARLRHLCPDAVDVQHIGSTAVPELSAKDVVDLQVEVADEAEADALAEPLAAGGFPRREDVRSDPVRPELDPDPAQWRKRLHLSADPGRAADVHVRVARSTPARAALALRDLLRADPAARQAYDTEKARLAHLHRDDVDAYAEGEAAVLVPLLVRALRR